mgnify:CR=1 FL=1
MTKLEEFYRGDTKAFELQFKEKDSGDPIDTTGWELTFTMKQHTEQPDSEAVIQVVKVVDDTEGPTGNVSMVLDSADTENLLATTYVYDFQLKRGVVVSTLLMGRIRVLAEVSHA